MKLSTKVAYNAIAQFISKVAATALGLFAIAVMARGLGTEGFGAYTTIITFLSFFGIIADFGLTLVTVQMINKPGIDRQRILSNLFTLRLASAAVFLSLAPLIALAFPYSAEINGGIAIGAASFVFIALNQVLVGLFQTNLRMDKVSIAEVFGRAVMLLGVIISHRENAGLHGYIIASVAGSIANFIALYAYSRAFFKISFAFDREVWKETFKFAWPLSITIILNLLYLKTDTLLLSLWKSQKEVGIYGAAYKVIDVVVTIPFIFCGIVLPILSRSWSARDLNAFRAVFQKSFNAMAILAVPLIFGAGLTGTAIMSLVAGSDFTGSGPVLGILSAAAAAIYIGSVPAHAIIAVGAQKKTIPAYAFTAITAVAGYALFIPKYGLYGAAWVTIYSEAVIMLFSLYYSARYAGFFPDLSIILKSAAASCLMALFLLLLPGLPILLAVAAGGLIYLGSLYLFRGITREELLDLIER